MPKKRNFVLEDRSTALCIIGSNDLLFCRVGRLFDHAVTVIQRGHIASKTDFFLVKLELIVTLTMKEFKLESSKKSYITEDWREFREGIISDALHANHWPWT